MYFSLSPGTSVTLLEMSDTAIDTAIISSRVIFVASTRSSIHYARTLWASVSSPNLRKVLGILTDTADIDACVIERVRVNVSSPNLWIVFRIARSGKALLHTKYIYLHQPSMVSSYIIVFICINLFFYMLTIKDIYSCFEYLAGPSREKQRDSLRK